MFNNKYYVTSDSIEDMEFIGSDIEDEPPKRSQLHIVTPWISTDGDFSHLQAWSMCYNIYIKKSSLLYYYVLLHLYTDHTNAILLYQYLS